MALRITRAPLTALPKPSIASSPRLNSTVNQKTKTTTLEVERKFRRLTVPTLTNLRRPQGGLKLYNPPFQSVQPLPTRQIHDVYYDTPHRTLCSAGAWIRKRNGIWEAKIKRGGDFVNSRFEEVVGEREVGWLVSTCLGGGKDSKAKERVGDREAVARQGGGGAEDNFGLQTLAEFVTTREAWLVNGEFKVVRDRMDFGHEVGEVELQVEVHGDGEGMGEEEKGVLMEEMDQRIEAFMRRYAWAWERGDAVGKLTAYFEMVKARGGKGV